MTKMDDLIATPLQIVHWLPSSCRNAFNECYLYGYFRIVPYTSFIILFNVYPFEYLIGNMEIYLRFLSFANIFQGDKVIHWFLSEREYILCEKGV